jgi:alpha-glycerophosphate oxidase/glycerol-3-phosphate dehydrogenase
VSLSLRKNNIRKLTQRHFDVIILGAGINGAVSAAALAARGVKVALIDKGDFGGSTSSQSSNLAWGGIKYLESGELRLVSRLCKSRNHLMRSFPSTVKEIRFLTTVQKGFRWPAPLLYLGTLLYWLMGRFATKAPTAMSREGLGRRDPRIRADSASGGFEYSDCYLHDNDSRFVFSFVRTAMNYGAVAANYVGATAVARKDGHWVVSIRDEIDGLTSEVECDVLINACGPEVDRVNIMTAKKTTYRHVFSKGVHLIVDRTPDRSRILAFFASDGRLFFVIPMGPKTCIGTTDTQVSDPAVKVDDKDRDFILSNANELLNLPRPLTKGDIIAERCGVRPLAVSGQSRSTNWMELSRKHQVEVSEPDAHISIFGGKLTDCINIGEEIVEIVASLGVKFPVEPRRWYGEPNVKVKEEFVVQANLLGLDHLADPRSCEPLTDRLWRRYGANAFEMLETVRENPRNADRLLEHAEYLRCEIEQAGRREMITKLEDFLRRRSKISLVVRHRDIIDDPSLREFCEILFGDQADAKLREYIEQTQPDELSVIV